MTKQIIIKQIIDDLAALATKPKKQDGEALKKALNKVRLEAAKAADIDATLTAKDREELLWDSFELTAYYKAYMAGENTLEAANKTRIHNNHTRPTSIVATAIFGAICLTAVAAIVATALIPALPVAIIIFASLVAAASALITIGCGLAIKNRPDFREQLTELPQDFVELGLKLQPILESQKTLGLFTVRHPIAQVESKYNEI